MYRDVVVRVYGVKEIKKIDELRASGVDITGLVVNAIKKYKTKVKLELVS